MKKFFDLMETFVILLVVLLLVGVTAEVTTEKTKTELAEDFLINEEGFDVVIYDEESDKFIAEGIWPDNKKTVKAEGTLVIEGDKVVDYTDLTLWGESDEPDAWIYLGSLKNSAAEWRWFLDAEVWLGLKNEF